MSDVTIPEDVMERARNVASIIHFKSQRAFVPEEGEKIIALAILDERERCAKLAQKLYDDWNAGPWLPGTIDDEPPSAAAAARAIRFDRLIEKVNSAIEHEVPNG